MTKSKNLRRLLSVVLAVTMLLVLVPASWAEEAPVEEVNLNEEAVELVEAEADLEMAEATEEPAEEETPLEEVPEEAVQEESTSTEETSPAEEVVPEAEESYVYFTVEKLTIGQGFIVEPRKISFSELKKAYSSLTALTDGNIAQVTEYVLGDKSGNYGQAITGSYYLGKIKDGAAVGSAINIPAAIQAALSKDGTALETTRGEANWLSQFDYTSDSGWVYMQNNAGISETAGGTKIKANDVIRLSFTVYGYGADIFASSFGKDALGEYANKDNLVKAVADINYAKTSANYGTAYTNALSILGKWEATQVEVDSALHALNNYGNTYTVTYNLSNLTNTNGLLSVIKDSSYSATLQAADGYKLPETISLSMNSSGLTAGTDYTYDSSNGQISLAKISGDLVITASGSRALEGDVNFDGQVDGADLLLVIGNYNGTTSTGDANGDGKVDGADLLLVIGNYGVSNS